MWLEKHRRYKEKGQECSDIARYADPYMNLLGAVITKALH